MIGAMMLRLALSAVIGGAAAQPTTRPASNVDEPDSPVGKRPYELDWANRTKPNNPQLADFEDLSGWRVQCRDGADATLYRSQQEVLFGKYVAKVVYTGKSTRSSLVIEPPEPIEIPNNFTAVNLWVRGNHWGWIHPLPPRKGSVRILVRDAKDEQYGIDLGMANFDYWFLMHRTVASPNGDKRMYQRTDGKFDEVIDYPARFVGIELRGFANEEPARMYFDALSFYEIQYPPLTFEPAPEKLAWPTTPHTILPTFEEPVRNSIRARGDGYELTATDSSGTIRYRYAPTDGTLGDITVEAGGQTFQPCFDGGITFGLDGKEVRPGSSGVATRLVSRKPAGYKIAAEWEISTGPSSARYIYDFHLKGKSLVVDVIAKGGLATRFDIGLAKGLAEAKTVFVPYLTYGNNWPKVVCSPGQGQPVFFLSLLDWYNSDASELYGSPRLTVPDTIRYNGGAEYNPLTNGRRNDLRERLFINVSTDFHEVLPNIPNPKCDTGQIAREFVWRNIGSPQREMLAKYKAYGIDKFIACHHEVGWRDAGESFTMRLRAAPRIGDDELADYSKWLRGLGYRFGTYTNYVDFAPVNSNWNEDDVCLNSDGTWQRAWPRCYALKPLRAVEKEAWHAPRIHQKFGTDAQYCDVHTAYKPWGRTDYDARVPGAGKFRTQFNSFARLLHNESQAHDGPVFSEGSYHWFYAGIVDGNYATIVPYGQGWRINPIVDFDLLKMHPLMTDFGMGMPQMYYGQGSHWQKDRSRLNPFFDRFHTATIAYGHIGFLASEWGFDGTLKSYYLLQALQQRYAMIPVRRIRYFDGQKLIDTSTAIATDAYKRRQINVVYKNGLELWCNLSTDNDWTVRVDQREYLLPPASFAAHKANDILAYSATVAGQRHELVSCRDYLYLDSRDQLVRTPVLTAHGTVAVKPDGKSAWWIIPATKCAEVTVSTAWLGVRRSAVLAATAHDQAGKKLGDAEVRRGSDEVTVMPVKNAVKYHLTADQTKRTSQVDWSLRCPRHALLQSTTTPIWITIRMPGGQDPRSLPLTVECVPANGSPITLGHTQLTSTIKMSMLRGRFDLRLPPDCPLHSRCWYRFTLPNSDVKQLSQCWLDVTALPAFDVAIEPFAEPCFLGRPVKLQTSVQSHLAQPVEAAARLTTPPDWQAKPSQQTVRLQPGQPTLLQWSLTLPSEPTVGQLSIDLSHGSHVSTIHRFVRTRPTDWTVAQLTDMAMTTGQCIRGSTEQPIDPQVSGASVVVAEDRVGRKPLGTIFMHPPYKTGVGYSFATIAVELPAGRPRLDFALGFRDGSTTIDGCLFKVVVIDGKKQAVVFAEQYSELAKWANRSADLAAFAGKSVVLKLITDVGPKDDSNSDWACWGQPRVVLDEDIVAVELHESRPAPLFAPPPVALADLRAADLSKIASADVRLETAGVNDGQYTSYVYFNDEKIGTTPTSSSDTAWNPGAVALSPEAVRTIGPKNRLFIRNPGHDCMKLRNICLHFALADGRHGSSRVNLGVFCSDQGWKYAEGTGVPLGRDLPVIDLPIPLSKHKS